VLGPGLLAVTVIATVAILFPQGRPKASVQAQALAEAIKAGPGPDFPLTYDAPYTTQVHLGMHRYLALRADYVAALTGDAAAYVVVQDPSAVIREVAAAGGHATALLATRAGSGIVANRLNWERGPSLRLVMGPVQILVEHADWQSMRGRHLRLAPVEDGEATVAIANGGPFREPFVVHVQGAKKALAMDIPPHTQSRATWGATAGWRQSVQPIAPENGRPR
jgi:hypothetical protein